MANVVLVYVALEKALNSNVCSLHYDAQLLHPLEELLRIFKTFSLCRRKEASGNRSFVRGVLCVLLYSIKERYRLQQPVQY